MSDYKTLTCADVAVGDKLPPLAIDITTSLVVCGALATRDFEPVHHNKAAAMATGLPDVFMNILTSQGLMTRYATDWSGPEAVVKSIDMRLGAPNVPGMVMTMTGEVTRSRRRQRPGRYRRGGRKQYLGHAHAGLCPTRITEGGLSRGC